MNLEKTVKSLEQKLYTVKCFDTHEEAADYLDAQIDGKVVGFGDSRTIIDMKLYDKLSKHNTVYDPNQSVDNDGFLEIDPSKIADTKELITVFNGEIMYELKESE